MDSKRVPMLINIQALEFTAVELTLFLDTHPNDQRALMDYNQVTQQLRVAKSLYEQRYGPLMVFGNSPSKYPWQWIEEPWPWEIEY